MQTRTKILIAGAAAAILVGGAAVAAASSAGRGWYGHRGHHGMMGGMFMREMLSTVDANGDGKLTQAEIDQARNERFARYDANNDGKLSLDEFEGLWLEVSRPIRVRAFQWLDPDGDAALTSDEMDRRFGRVVERFDRNGDGFLSPDDRRYRHGRQSRDRDHNRDDDRDDD